MVYLYASKKTEDNSINENSINKLLLNSIKCKNLIDIAFNRMDYDSSLPISIELHLTNRCNLNCEWCVDRPIRKNIEEIPFSSLLRLLDFLEGNNIGITIEGGGEPTVYAHFEEFVLECAKRNINIGLITNGVKRLSPTIIQYFNWIRVSLDAATPEEYIREKGKDYFNTIIENIRFMRENSRELVLGVSYVLTNRNYQSLCKLFVLLEDIRINYIRFRNVEEYKELTLTASMMDEVQETIDKFKLKLPINMILSTDTQTCQSNNNMLPCIAHSLRSIIHANGEVVLCEKRRHDPIVLGNIINDDFLEIWNSEKRISAARKLLNKDSQNGCTICRITKFNELFHGLTQVKTSNFI